MYCTVPEERGGGERHLVDGSCPCAVGRGWENQSVLTGSGPWAGKRWGFLVFPLAVSAPGWGPGRRRGLGAVLRCPLCLVFSLP